MTYDFENLLTVIKAERQHVLEKEEILRNAVLEFLEKIPCEKISFLNDEAPHGMRSNPKYQIGGLSFYIRRSNNVCMADIKGNVSISLPVETFDIIEQRYAIGQRIRNMAESIEFISLNTPS